MNYQYRFRIYYLIRRVDGSYHRTRTELIVSDSSLGEAISRLVSWFERYLDIAKYTYRVSEIHGPIVPGYTVFSNSHDLYKIDPKSLIGGNDESSSKA